LIRFRIIISAIEGGSSELNVSSSSPLLPGLEVSNHRASHRLLRVLGGGVEDEGGDNIGVDVGGRSSVLDVALSIIGSDLGRDSEGGSSVSDSEREGLDRGSFVVTSQSFLVVITIEITVELMVLGESLHHVEDVLHTLRTFSHDGSRVVGVATRSVPVGEELGGVGHTHSVVFSDAGKKVARHQKFVSDGDSSARTNLVFPLARHNLSVGS